MTPELLRYFVTNARPAAMRPAFLCAFIVCGTAFICDQVVFKPQEQHRQLIAAVMQLETTAAEEE